MTGNGVSQNAVRITALTIFDEDRDYMPDTFSDLRLIYCYKGAVTVSLSGSQHNLTPGWFLFSRSEDKGHITAGKLHAECYILELSFVRSSPDREKVPGTVTGFCAADLFQASDTLIRFDVEENRILLTLTELANELTNHRTADHHLTDLLLEVLLIKLERAVQKHGRATGFRYVTEAKQFIRDHLGSAITVQDVADHIGIHRSYLMNIFRTQTHMSVNQYINRMRITQACVLLSDPRLSVTEIAFQVGFNSRQNFYIAFEKATGCSPSKYRISQVTEGSWEEITAPRP